MEIIQEYYLTIKETSHGSDVRVFEKITKYIEINHTLKQANDQRTAHKKSGK